MRSPEHFGFSKELQRPDMRQQSNEGGAVREGVGIREFNSITRGRGNYQVAVSGLLHHHGSIPISFLILSTLSTTNRDSVLLVIYTSDFKK